MLIRLLLCMLVDAFGNHSAAFESCLGAFRDPLGAFGGPLGTLERHWGAIRIQEFDYGRPQGRLGSHPCSKVRLWKPFGPSVELKCLQFVINKKDYFRLSGKRIFYKVC